MLYRVNSFLTGRLSKLYWWGSWVEKLVVCVHLLIPNIKSKFRPDLSSSSRYAVAAIFLGTDARLRCGDRIPSLSFAETTVGTRTSVKSLGMTIDSGMTIDKHIDNICKVSACHVRSLHHTRKDAATSVATALVNACINYCNSLLYGTSISNIDKLQRLQNSLACAVMCTGKLAPCQCLYNVQSRTARTQGVDHAANTISVVIGPCQSAFSDHHLTKFCAAQHQGLRSRYACSV